MKKTMKNIIGYNLKTLLGFEAIYKLASTIIFVPLFLSLFRFLTQLTGYSYLTFENIGSFLFNPITIFFLILLLFLMTFYTLLDISAVLIILDSSYQKRKISIKESFFLAWKKSILVFDRKNFLFPFLVLFLIPFLNLGISSGFISTLSVPEFIMDYIRNNTFLSILYLCFFLALSMLLFRWLYAIHYFVLENCNLKEAREKSIQLNKKRKIKDFLTILLVQVFLAIFYLLFIGIGIFLILFLYKIFGKENLFGTLSITMIWLLIAISFIIITLLSMPIGYACISILYYHHKEEKQEKIIHIKVSEKEKQEIPKKVKQFKYLFYFLIFLSASLFTYSILNGKYDFQIEHIRTMEVTAHRGASALYPENTMAAFVGAKRLGADWIELDVQQTKDKKLIVLHDTNLKRTTGVSKNTWELTYQEIEKLDAGSFFQEKFKGEKIPLLKDVLSFAKENHIQLNIELKPTGKEKDFEKSVVELLQKYNFKKNCVITSQVYQVLEKVKKIDPSIKTVYVMSLAYGNITELKAADHFSIEESSVVEGLVQRIHQEGKQLFVWTVNTKKNIQKMIDLNVDNIITDRISLAKDTIYSSKTSNLVQEYRKAVNRILK